MSKWLVDYGAGKRLGHKEWSNRSAISKIEWPCTYCVDRVLSGLVAQDRDALSLTGSWRNNCISKTIAFFMNSESFKLLGICNGPDRPTATGRNHSTSKPSQCAKERLSHLSGRSNVVHSSEDPTQFRKMPV